MATSKKDVRQASEDFLLFLERILRPAAAEFDGRLYAKDLRLHHVFQTNVVAAHMIDYLAAIRKAKRIDESRTKLVKSFDETYAVEGAQFLNRKFQIVDAVNNALKHIQLDPQRYRDLSNEYGAISFRCLREDSGLVLFEADQYRFDFARVVLRPVLQAVVPWVFDDIEAVVDFALGDCAHVEACDDLDDDPIDQMIDYCNPICLDCGEGADDCRCSKFVYGGKTGEFRGNWDESFDFDSVMFRISGAYRPD